MKWIRIKGTHINTHLVTTFFWRDGQLWMNFSGDVETVTWDDPDRQLYVKLCHDLGVLPYEGVVPDGKK